MLSKNLECNNFFKVWVRLCMQILLYPVFDVQVTNF